MSIVKQRKTKIIAQGENGQENQLRIVKRGASVQSKQLRDLNESRNNHNIISKESSTPQNDQTLFQYPQRTESSNMKVSKAQSLA